MRSVAVLFISCVCFFGCGGYDDESSINESNYGEKIANPLSKVDRLTNPRELSMKEFRTDMIWHISSAYCGGWGPYVSFFDIDNGDTWGPFYPGAYSGSMHIMIPCVVGHKICYGAWLMQKDYYDCSDAELTRTCVHVAANPEYRYWGCGLDCKHTPSLVPPTCYECVEGAEINKYLGCGN